MNAGLAKPTSSRRLKTDLVRAAALLRDHAAMSDAPRGAEARSAAKLERLAALLGDGRAVLVPLALGSDRSRLEYAAARAVEELAQFLADHGHPVAGDLILNHSKTSADVRGVGFRLLEAYTAAEVEASVGYVADVLKSDPDTDLERAVYEEAERAGTYYADQEAHVVGLENESRDAIEEVGLKESLAQEESVSGVLGAIAFRGYADAMERALLHEVQDPATALPVEVLKAHARAYGSSPAKLQEA